jgi:hypothetical protein
VSYTYVMSEYHPGLWTVGYYTPSGTWQPESDHHSPKEAAKRAAWLNGAASEPDSGVTVLAVLRDHWLAEIACDHDRGTDRPRCACSQVDLGEHPSVGYAVQAWINHVGDQATLRAAATPEEPRP